MTCELFSLQSKNPPYADLDPRVRVCCVTPTTSRAIHRYYDTSPFSPSGRFLVVTQLAREDRLPEPGAIAQVVLVDLLDGGERVVEKTRAWDTQVGAQTQWGRSDNELLFNDLDTDSWEPVTVVLDPFTGEKRKLQGPVFSASPDGELGASHCLLRSGQTQPGYGVLAPNEKLRSIEKRDDGFTVVNLRTGTSQLICDVSAAKSLLAKNTHQRWEKGRFRSFVVKWNPQGDRLLAVVSWEHTHRKRRRWWRKVATRRRLVITFKPDGSDVHLCVPPELWARGGHHPTWCPDGEFILMNLKPPHIQGAGLRFLKLRYDGTLVEQLAGDVPGSGHPTLHPSGR